MSTVDSMCGKPETRYGNSKREKLYGIVYTPVQMAEYVANEILKYDKRNDRDCVSILDPAVGEGELLAAMLTALKGSGRQIKAVGYETDAAVAARAQSKLEKLFPAAEIDIRAADFLQAVDEKTAGVYDYVIANPPYVRTQVMGSERAQEIAKKLSLAGRVDLYYAFLLNTKAVLKPDGVAGYITSNKFMTIKAGAPVRNYMLQNYRMHHITDLGDTKLFPASVLPCVLVFSPGSTGKENSVDFTSVYQDGAVQNVREIKDIFEAISVSGQFRIPDGRCYCYRQGRLQNAVKNALWTMTSDENKAWISAVESRTWMYFSQIGKIRVGIKTTADQVFIGEDWSGDKGKIELLRPLITHRNSGQIAANQCAQWQVLYTHKMENGKKVAYDINEYPYSRDYLLSHYDQLAKRSYIKKAHRNWYEIWVPQNPDAWKHRKIVFRDISEQPQFWLDESGAVVNGDCYWIDIFPEIPEDVICLALAVANSKFIEKYYDIRFNTRLYSGKRRYQTQYVEQFPIPYNDSIYARRAIELVKKIIAERDCEIAASYKKALDMAVDEMFS